MAPITVDPQALSGAGASMAAVGDGVAAAMSTSTGGFNANTGYDTAGIAFGRQYVSAGASLLKAMTAGVNACRNTGYGIQTSAVNYSRAESASDISGRSAPLGSPPCPAPVSVPGAPSSSGASVPPPLLWSVVAQFVGSPWPDGNPAEMRKAAVAWRAVAVPLYHTSGDASFAYNTIAAQRIDEGPLMTADIRDIGTNLAGVASSCQELAATLEQYAGEVEKTQEAIRHLCDQVGSIGGIVGTFFEFLHGHGEEELHKIADEIKTVLVYLGSEADASLALLESAKSSVDNWVLGLEKSVDRTFVEYFGDRVGGAVATHFNAAADSAEGVFRWGAGMAEGMIALDPTRFASDPEAAGQTWAGVAKFAQLVTNPGGAAVSDPHGTLETLKGLVHADDWSKDRPMLGASQNLLDIASVAMPGLGEAGAAGDAASAVGRVARVGEEASGAAGVVGKVGEFGRSTMALGGVTKDAAGLTDKMGTIADKPPAPPVGGRPVSLTEPVDAGHRTPLAKQPVPDAAPSVGRPGEPAGGDVAAGASDHPTSVGHEPGPESSPSAATHTLPPTAAVTGERAERVSAVAAAGGAEAPTVAAAEKIPALAGVPAEELRPVGNLSSSAPDGVQSIHPNQGGHRGDFGPADGEHPGLGVADGEKHPDDARHTDTHALHDGLGHEVPYEAPPLLVRENPFETGGIDPQYVGEQYPGGPMGSPGVKYLDDMDRAEYRITIHDGLVYDDRGQPFDTSHGVSAFGPGHEGRAIFVMDENGNFYASTFQRFQHFHHSSLLAGGEVAGAGELVVRNGRIELLTDQSGHYMPGRSRTQQVLEQLASQGIEIDPAKVQLIAPEGTR